MRLMKGLCLLVFGLLALPDAGYGQATGQAAAAYCRPRLTKPDRYFASGSFENCVTNGCTDATSIPPTTVAGYGIKGAPGGPNTAKACTAAQSKLLLGYLDSNQACAAFTKNPGSIACGWLNMNCSGGAAGPLAIDGTLLCTNPRACPMRTAKTQINGASYCCPLEDTPGSGGAKSLCCTKAAF